MAARNGADVTGVDVATNWIEAARGRAASEGLSARFDEGDAEELPYPDASFDIVATIYGAILRNALIELWSGANETRDAGRTVVRAEYLEVVATRADKKSR